jgi:UDP-3-O-[3-hydroxymyristoyl] glucosamine N-acyltransferase
MKLGELARALGRELRGDSELEIAAPVPIEAAGAGTITFVSQPRYLAMLERVSPSCVIVSSELAEQVPGAALISPNPAFDFARTLGIFYPPYRPQPGVHPTAHIAPGVQIGEGASIGAYVVIGSGVKIGARAVIHPHVTIYPGVSIGDDFICHSHVSIRENVAISDRVVLHNGAVVGSEGFGFVEVGEGLAKIPQTGNVVLESDIEIGANKHLCAAWGEARQPGSYRAQLRGRRLFALRRVDRDRRVDPGRRMVRIWGPDRGCGSCPDWQPG